LHLPYRDNENDLLGLCKSIRLVVFQTRFTNSVFMADLLLDPRSASLQLAGISKTYGPARVLIDVSLSINPGEVVALMGANGAGKSTLAKIASGVVKPDAGQILVAGRELKRTSPQVAHSHGIVKMASRPLSATAS
jgi:ABC-type bacteriocin/lantibiotic exporter with double-glycine peptidase domain